MFGGIILYIFLLFRQGLFSLVLLLFFLSFSLIFISLLSSFLASHTRDGHDIATPPHRTQIKPGRYRLELLAA